MRTFLSTLGCLIALAIAPAAIAHAFPDNSAPHVGAILDKSPSRVQVWFNGELEPVFSTLVVRNAGNVRVSAGKGGVDTANPRLLETSLPAPLPPGKYEVYWSVVARDGHHTAGHFAFSVK